MNDNFAFLLPITQATFGISFLVVAQWGSRPALCWGAGYLLSALGFASPLFLNDWSPPTAALVADLGFAAGFVFFGQALCEHFRMPRALLRTRLAIGVASFLLSAYSVLVLDTLRWELLSSDMGCVLLVAVPLLLAVGRCRSLVDRLIVALSWVVTLDNFVRGTTTAFTAPGAIADFETSQYAFLMQVSAAVTGMVFAMTALSSVVLAVIGEFRALAMHDPLSGLLNRRGFDDLALPIAQARPASVVVCDIDHFKVINDRYGHGHGDRIIACLAAIIRERTQRDAVAARFGGEEFVLLLPGRRAWEAALVAEMLRGAFAAEGWKAGGLHAPVTASFGISEIAASDLTVHDALRRADDALYDAKRAGRNRIATRLARGVAGDMAARWPAHHPLTAPKPEAA